MSATNFNGVRVLALESRRAQEISKLISNHLGIPVVVPSVRELPLESNTAALDFARKLELGAYDMVIFMTGVGVRLLTRVVERVYPAQKFASLLSKIAIVARGPKPVAVLREMGVPISVTVPEPNTWRDLVAALDQRAEELPLQGRRVVIQEYGTQNPELVAKLEKRGASVTSVPVYEWALPEDTSGLQEAVASIIREEISVVLLTSSLQLRHLFQVADSMGPQFSDGLRHALGKTMIASIGPLTSAEIGHQGLTVAMEPTSPQLGLLVQQAAEKSGALCRKHP